MADVVDNEELIATRKLHGLYDDLFEEEKEIEAGEYVRAKDGTIGIVEEATSVGCWIEKDFRISKRNITKHSKQLIELIEVKDLICFKNISSNTLENEEMIIHIFNNETLQEVKQAIEDEEIKIISILTKEQHMANCYKVGGEEKGM